MTQYPVEKMSGFFLAENLPVNALLKERTSWNKPIPIFMSFNGVDYFKLNQDITIIPDLVIEDI